MGGMHPVVAVDSTFLGRACDQLLMDCALHQLPVTVVLDRAGVTGPDGPSHHGMWDLALAGIVPGARVAAPRDAATLAEELREALDEADGPTVLRWPKGMVPDPIPAVRREGSVDVLTEPADGRAAQVLLVAVGAFAGVALQVADRLADQGIEVTVADPRWVLPVSDELVALAVRHQRVVTVEDGGRSGGVGAAVTDRLAGSGVPVTVLALPQEFLPAGTRDELLDEVGLSAQAVARRITELVVAGEALPSDEVSEGR
jgi:1-deoxy-D-xylulose-5-phosphate synthase